MQIRKLLLAGATTLLPAAVLAHGIQTQPVATQPPPTTTPAQQPSVTPPAYPQTTPPVQSDTMTTPQSQPETAPTPSQPATATVSDADLSTGAKVSDTSGASVGTITSKDDQNVTLALNGSTKVQVPRSAFSKGSRGLAVSVTRKQLQAAARQSQSTQPH
jgi:preprotein translocase subunit YajC